MDVSLQRNNQKETWETVIGVPMVTLTSCMFADYQRPAVAGDGGSVGAGRHRVALDVGIL